MKSTKKTYIFNKAKAIHDPAYLFYGIIFGDMFESLSAGWMNDCDGKPCYEKDGKIFCSHNKHTYEIDKDWCDIIEED